jgi:YaiO family outer membrane protein
MLTNAVVAVSVALGIAATVYLVLWNVLQFAMGTVAGRFIRHHVRQRTRRDRVLADRLTIVPLVSVIVPAYNEALTIVDSVRALLELDYESREIVVVNDGSSDTTLSVLQDTFQMVAAPLAFVQPLASEPVRGIYRSIREPALVVIDKQNGGCKADALNAGINVASGVLVLMIDADTVLEPDALSRAVLPFLEDPEMVAVGGNVAIANGCRIDHGRITHVALPRSWLARFQIIEYLRSFLLFRVAWVSTNALTIVSGAFGLFRREAVIAVGGYDRTAIGEDMDLTLRLQSFYRARRQPFRIFFDPFPLCSTQVPEDWASLRSQRCRWRRGLLQSLWRHRRLIGNPRFGVVGLCALPHLVVFEGLAPLVEISGYTIVTLAAILGILDWQHYGVLIAVALLFGTAATLLALLLSDLSMLRYPRGRDVALLVAAAIFENCGYRQLNAWWGCVGTVQAMSAGHGWGTIRRRAFEGNKTRATLLVALLLIVPARAAGQDDVLVRAREAATSGRRAEALAMLEAHLDRTPRDVDARLLYGLVLSWEGRYDEARPVLQQVLAQAPAYMDARVALMNVEYWSGNSTEAREQADHILADSPGNVTARAVRDRLAAANRPWLATTTYYFDTFDDDRGDWHEVSVALTRRTPVGALIFRGNHAARFGLDDQFIELEFYPRFRPGTYAFVAAGVAPDPTLYPDYRVAFDLYQSIGAGFEASAGARYMDFGSITQIYVGTLTKYIGNWMLTGKVYHVPAERDLSSTSYHAASRYYFGSDGTSWVGVSYGHGFSHEEIRNLGDLTTLDSDTVRGEFDVLFGSRLRIFASGGTSRQEFPQRSPLWQTSVSSGLSVQF